MEASRLRESPDTPRRTPVLHCLYNGASTFPWRYTKFDVCRAATPGKAIVPTWMESGHGGLNGMWPGKCSAKALPGMRRRCVEDVVGSVTGDLIGDMGRAPRKVAAARSPGTPSQASPP